jgi:uncharacterized membrane protein HdeD (DUF308 family)
MEDPMAQTETTPDGSVDDFSGAWLLVLLGGVVSVVLGLVLIAWPGQTIVVVGVITAIWLVAIGLVTLVGGFSKSLSGGSRALLFITGALVLLAGLVMFRGAFDLVIVLAILLGIGLLLRSLALFVRASEEPDRRGWLILGGTVFAVLSVAVFIWPELSLGTFVWITGFVLVVTGIFEVVGAFFLKHDMGA